MMTCIYNTDSSNPLGLARGWGFQTEQSVMSISLELEIGKGRRVSTRQVNKETSFQVLQNRSWASYKSNHSSALAYSFSIASLILPPKSLSTLANTSAI